MEFRYTIFAEQGDNCVDVVRTNAADVAGEILDLMREKHGGEGIVFHLDDIYKVKSLSEILADGEPF